MVSNEEIRRMLDAKRRGLDTKKHDEKSMHYKECPNCGFKNPEKAIFCVSCGKKLEKNVTTKCEACGTENLKNAKFCVGCGEDLTKPGPENKPKTNNNNQVKEISEEKSNQNNAEETDNEDNEDNFTHISEESEIKESEDEIVKPVIKQGIPSSVPDHNLINQEKSKKTCPSCNSKNLKNAKFCVICGEKFLDEPKAEKSVSDEDLNTKSIDNDSKSSENDDPIEKIKKAKELLDMGAITSEEFETIKMKYLDRI